MEIEESPETGAIKEVKELAHEMEEVVAQKGDVLQQNGKLVAGLVLECNRALMLAREMVVQEGKGEQLGENLGIRGDGTSSAKLKGPAGGALKAAAATARKAQRRGKRKGLAARSSGSFRRALSIRPSC